MAEKIGGFPSGWYGLLPVAAFTRLDDARAELPKMRGLGEDLLAESIASQLDLLDTLHAGSGVIGLGAGKYLVIEKLPDGSAICMTTTEDTRADSPGEAFKSAVATGLLMHGGLIVRYCNALPPGHLPASAVPPGATAH